MNNLLFQIVALKKESTNYDYVSILDLPNEILLKILSYLSTRDILGNVAKVSKKFQKLTQNSTLIRKIEVNVNWLRNTGYWNMTHDDFLDVWKRSRGLRSFNLVFDQLDRDQINLWTKIEKVLPFLDHPVLEEFILRFNYLSPKHEQELGDFFKNVLQYLHQCPSLKKVKFYIPFSEISEFISGFEHKNLTELYLYAGQILEIEKSSFKKFLEIVVGNFPKLQHLYFGFLVLPKATVWPEGHFVQIAKKIASEKKVQIVIGYGYSKNID